ncbi:MAG: hypothetical protein IJ235_07245, partial [Eubacterium sp.]|nr:hypothetical protein [Eubacterium sp.]
MIKLHYSKIRFAALLLLLIPSVIFMLTWVKPLIGIPFVIILCAGLFCASKTDSRTIEVKATTLIALAVLILLWAFLSGQGGFFTQKSDHEIRNVILRDLINYKWPVRYNEAGDISLVYYIGYWLLPALVGKAVIGLGGNFAAGWLAARIALLIWTAVLVYTAFLLVLFKVGKSRRKAIYLTFMIFVLFSGMDALCSLAHSEDFRSHIEWWAGYFQYSSMSTQLCWVFNQAVPAWLACAVAFNEKDEKSFAFIGLLLLPTSPLPFVGLTVYMLAFAVRSFILAVRDKQISAFFKNIFTLQNIVALVTLLPVFGTYYLNNAASINTDGNSVSEAASVQNGLFGYFVMYVMFVLFEFGFLLVFVKNKNNRFESLVVLCSLLIIPFIKV